jgi:hypothetical protein
MQHTTSGQSVTSLGLGKKEPYCSCVPSISRLNKPSKIIITLGTSNLFLAYTEE